MATEDEKRARQMTSLQQIVARARNAALIRELDLSDTPDWVKELCKAELARRGVQLIEVAP